MTPAASCRPEASIVRKHRCCCRKAVPIRLVAIVHFLFREMMPRELFPPGSNSEERIKLLSGRQMSQEISWESQFLWLVTPLLQVPLKVLVIDQVAVTEIRPSRNGGELCSSSSSRAFPAVASNSLARLALALSKTEKLLFWPWHSLNHRSST